MRLQPLIARGPAAPPPPGRRAPRPVAVVRRIDRAGHVNKDVSVLKNETVPWLGCEG